MVLYCSRGPLLHVHYILSLTVPLPYIHTVHINTGTSKDETELELEVYGQGCSRLMRQLDTDWDGEHSKQSTDRSIEKNEIPSR